MRQFFTFSTMALACLTATASPQGFELLEPANYQEAPVKKAPAKAADNVLTVTDVILNPEGDAQSYDKSATGYENFYSMLLEYTQSFSTTIVWGADGEVYIQDFISKNKTNSYIVGSAQGEEVVFNLPQTVYWNETMQNGVNLVAIDTEIQGGELVWTYAADQTITMTKGEDGSLTLTGVPEGRMYGYVDIANEEWSGYADWEQRYMPRANSPIAAPDDAEWQQWSCTAVRKGKPYLNVVDVALQNDKMWIKGLCRDMPEATVEAYIDGQTVTIPQGEWLGDYYDRFPMFTLLGYLTEGDWGMEVKLLPFDQVYTFDYDPETMTLTATDPDTVFLFNNGISEENNLDYWQNLSLQRVESLAGIPSNPTNLEVEDIPNDCLLFTFDINPVSTTGSLLDYNSLSYRIYLDGDIFTFYADEFPRGLPGDVEECEEIPLSFSNGGDIYRWSDTSFEVDLSVLDATTLGVQTVYNYDGVVNDSDIVTIDVATGDISVTVGTGMTFGDIVTADAFGLLGRRVAAESTGLVIERQILSDGTTRTIKRIVR